MFYRETEFQKTEIGEIPKDWNIERLGRLINYVKGKKPKKLYDQKINENSLPYLTAEYMRGLETPKWCNPKEETDIIKVNSDDVIMIWDGSYAGHVFTGFNGVLASTMIKIIPKYNNLDKKFLYYYLTISSRRLRGTTVGTGVPHINKKIFEELYIPLPPLEEQKRIADILSMIDSSIESVDRAIARLERIKKALLNELLTGRIRVREENGKLMFYRETEFQDTEIGKIPKDWKIEKLKNIVIKAKMGGTPKSTVHEYWGGDIPFAKVEDITSSRKYLFKTSTTITKLGLENSNAWIVPKDSLLITIYGTLGAVAINKIELVTNQAIVGIIPRKDIVDVEYLYYWYSFFQPSWNKYVKKSTQPNLTLEIVTNSKLPLPSIKEQKRIVDILSIIDSTIELYYREKEKLLRLRRGLMGVLLTGRVRVVSDVRDVGVVV